VLVNKIHFFPQEVVHDPLSWKDGIIYKESESAVCGIWTREAARESALVSSVLTPKKPICIDPYLTDLPLCLEGTLPSNTKKVIPLLQSRRKRGG